MKKYILLSIIAIAAMVVSGCQKENSSISPEKGKKTRLVTLNTSEPETKTGLIAVPGGYKSTWISGDFIWLFECNPEKADDYEKVRSYESSQLKDSDIVDNKASFTVEINADEPQAAKYTYMAAYAPYADAFFSHWKQASDEEYTGWCEQFGYTGEYLPAHMQVWLEFSRNQCPGPDSFDPMSDLLISKTIETAGQMEGEFALRFARLGTIVKITLTGLDAYKGMPLSRANLSVGKSFSKSFAVLFDPVLDKYAHSVSAEPSSDIMEDSSGGTMFWLHPSGVVVKDDGTADLWVRTYAGELTDEFSLELFIEGENGEVILKRNVNLMKEGKTIKFNEGGMTTFSVGGWGVADVPGVYCTTQVNETMDGFTATWEGVENAVGYDCYLTGYGDSATYPETVMTPVNNGDGTWSVKVESGLQPMTYVFHIKPIPAEGHCLIYDDYDYFEMKIGVPDVWWFAHDCFGSSESEYIEGTEAEYIIDFSPGKVRFKNLSRMYDYAWQVLNAKGPWFMYSTEPLKKMHSIEVWSKDDSHLGFKVYASATPNEHTEELTGTVVEVSEVDAGSGSYHYQAVHKRVRYTFPEGKTYQYYTICGDNAGIVMTSQYTYVYYFK